MNRCCEQLSRRGGGWRRVHARGDAPLELERCGLSRGRRRDARDTIARKGLEGRRAQPEHTPEPAPKSERPRQSPSGPGRRAAESEREGARNAKRLAMVQMRRAQQEVETCRGSRVPRLSTLCICMCTNGRTAVGYSSTAVWRAEASLLGCSAACSAARAPFWPGLRMWEVRRRVLRAHSVHRRASASACALCHGASRGC